MQRTDHDRYVFLQTLFGCARNKIRTVVSHYEHWPVRGDLRQPALYLLADKGTSATSPIEPALNNLVHARADLVVGIVELAGGLELADHRPVVGADRVRLARAVREGALTT